MKKVKIATIILTVILISLISFAGVYVQKQNRMENQVKGYKLGMHLSGYRQIRLEPIVPEGNAEITDEDVDKTKEIIQTRLEKLGATEYLIRTSKDSIVLELKEDENTNNLISNTIQQGKFEIIDKKTKDVLMTNEDIKLANAVYSNTQSGTTAVYLNIEFTKKGTTKFEEITKNYATTEETKKLREENNNLGLDSLTGNSTASATEDPNQPKISIQIDGEEILSQSFDNPITSGKIQVPLSRTRNNDTLQKNIQSAKAVAVILDNGILPIKYKLTENEYVYSEIKSETLIIFSIVIAVITLIALAVLIVKHKMRGLIASILYIGLIALYLLILRYTNVELTIGGIAGILIVLIINYIITLRIVGKKKIIQEDLIPIAIATIAFCFIGWSQIASLGMVMFWGAVTLIYHMITIKVLDN